MQVSAPPARPPHVGDAHDHRPAGAQQLPGDLVRVPQVLQHLEAEHEVVAAVGLVPAEVGHQGLHSLPGHDVAQVERQPLVEPIQLPQ